MAVESNIFFFWMGGEMPALYRRNVELAQISNPNHTVHVLGLDAAVESVAKLSPKLAELLPSIRIPSAISDIFRFAILHDRGGWYFDCDVISRASVEFWERPDKDAHVFWRMDNNKVIIQGSLIASRAGHPMMRDVVDTIERLLLAELYPHGVYRTTGPIAVLAPISRYAHHADVDYREADYTFWDVAGDATKGSWTYQENVGILVDDTHPPRFNPNSPVERIGSIAAFRFYCDTFDAYPQTQAENYRSMLRKLGAHLVLDRGIRQEVMTLVRKYLDPAEDVEHFRAVADALEQVGAEADAVDLRRLI